MSLRRNHARNEWSRCWVNFVITKIVIFLYTAVRFCLRQARHHLDRVSTYVSDWITLCKFYAHLKQQNQQLTSLEICNGPWCIEEEQSRVGCIASGLYLKTRQELYGFKDSMMTKVDLESLYIPGSWRYQCWKYDSLRWYSHYGTSDLNYGYHSNIMREWIDGINVQDFWILESWSSSSTRSHAPHHRLPQTPSTEDTRNDEGLMWRGFSQPPTFPSSGNSQHQRTKEV